MYSLRRVKENKGIKVTFMSFQTCMNNEIWSVLHHSVTVYGFRNVKRNIMHPKLCLGSFGRL